PPELRLSRTSSHSVLCGNWLAYGRHIFPSSPHTRIGSAGRSSDPLSTRETLTWIEPFGVGCESTIPWTTSGPLLARCWNGAPLTSQRHASDGERKKTSDSPATPPLPASFL